MASQPESIKLTPGGLNLLAPVDQLPPEDCLRLDGWWPASVGRLQQGLGFSIRSAPGAFAFIDSMVQVGASFYYGGNGKLFLDGRAGNAAIDSGYDSTPLGLTASQNYAWVMNRNKQRKDDSSHTTNWTTETPDFSIGPITPATVTAGAGTALAAGDYDIYVTFENVDAHMGNPSTKYTVTIAAGDKITVNRPARVENTAGWYAVTGWNVYIQSPGMAQPYRIAHTVLDYATRATYDYTGTVAAMQDDESVIAFDLPLAMDHDPAPAASVAANTLFNSRIVVANSANHTNRIWWTNASEPSYFPGSDGSPEGNWLDVGEDDGDPILAITVKVGLLMIYRRRSIWRHVGDFDDPNAKLEPVVPDMGVVGVRGVVATALGDFFVSDEGIYRQNDWPVKVSQKIEPLFLSETTSPYEVILDSWRSHCAIGFENGRLWFSYPGSNAPVQTGNTHAMVLHVETSRWFAHSWPVGFGAFLNCGNNDAEFAAGSLYVYTLSQSVGAPWSPTVEYQSGYQDCGLPDHEKTYPDVVISHNTRGLSLTVTVWVNKGAASYPVATLTSSSLTRQTIALLYPVGHPEAGKPIRASNLSIEIAGYAAFNGSPVLIEGPIILHWYDRPRQAKVYDSGETGLGIQGYKSIDQVELDVDVPAANLWEMQLWSDIEGNGVTVARRMALPQTQGREILLFPVASLDGRLFRLMGTAAAGSAPTATDSFELYGLRVRVLPIGVYVDGTVADSWLTQPIPIGV